MSSSCNAHRHSVARADQLHSQREVIQAKHGTGGKGRREKTNTYEVRTNATTDILNYLNHNRLWLTDWNWTLKSSRTHTNQPTNTICALDILRTHLILAFSSTRNGWVNGDIVAVVVVGDLYFNSTVLFFLGRICTTDTTTAATQCPPFRADCAAETFVRVRDTLHNTHTHTNTTTNPSIGVGETR